MGSSSSRPGLNPSQESRPNRFSRLSSSLFIWGSSPSRAPVEMEDYPTEIMVKSAERPDSVANMVQSPLEESTSVCGTETRFWSTGTETATSSENNIEASGEPSIKVGSRDVETSNSRKCLTESTEMVVPQVSSDYSHGESHRDSSTSAIISFKEQQSSDHVSVNLSTNEDAVNGFENKGPSQLFPESSILSSQRPEDSHLHGTPVVNWSGEVTTVHSLGTDSAPRVSELMTFNSLDDESIREMIPSGLGFLLSNREQGQGDAVLHVDVVSISSNILSGRSADASNRESGRNGRRLFWDAISRHSSRRHHDSPSIFPATGDSNDTSLHDRWLLNVSGDIFHDGAGGDSGYLSSSRIHSLNERRQHSRSEIWERLLGGHDENSLQTTFCPSGLHPDGTCSCDSLLMTDESSTRASISRIVMLAEALFEVLDEIHHQPVSLSLSMVSVPAPESVVDSFPLRNHKKVSASKDGNVVEQCRICLSEYEEEEKIRVLPCQHEFHMSCVDKWLKEIQGVCPLCRGDVRLGVDLPVSNSEVPSL
ncbi:hypothetical protein F3Y22_tig00110890pilonHSYRG00939 [Hibiscus syriacus]|uniref:RING-type domain-containing protein n=1 Tax=Hibiscus syriacus TaxID=106335 RepID=A0A6A2ZHJ7_HIBSY|nr:uncharacterized protein LOC120144871 isoform X2 [Hibiscus syriacus]KAE8691338.1 hypothetical protein F3Y22_tig00110890pilonHSYRG00939 [Hibiscus syriacus]